MRRRARTHMRRAWCAHGIWQCVVAAAAIVLGGAPIAPLILAGVSFAAVLLHPMGRPKQAALPAGDDNV